MIKIPTWKREAIYIDFVVRVAKTRKINDSIWVDIERMTKLSHLIHVKYTFKVEYYPKLYI